MKTAVIYARYSSEKQNEQSIESQLRICNQFASANGLTVLDTYVDRATTGTNDQRAAFQQMLSDCAKPVPWDIVLVYAIDRFGRNSIEIAVNKQKLKKHKKTLISATQRTSENIDGTKNLDGILLENVYIGLAEYYSAELSQKVMRGMYENRKKGLFCGGQVPFGYRVVNKRLVVEENEAEAVRYIFQQYANGKVAREIIKELTERGILYHGKPFVQNTFYSLIRGEKYIGINRHGDEVFTNRFPPIVPKPLFYEVQRILARNKIGTASRQTDFILKGKIFCGYCGRKINGESGTSHTGAVSYYYKCSARKKRLNDCQKSIIKKEKLETLVIDTTLSLLRNPTNLDAIADAAIETYKQQQRDKSILSILTNEYNQTKKTLGNVMKAIEEGILTPTTKLRMEELEQKLVELEDKIQIEQYSLQTQITKEQVIAFLEHSIACDPKTIVYTAINKIILFDDKIKIYYNLIDNTYPDELSSDDRREFIWNKGSTMLHAGAPKEYNPNCLLVTSEWFGFTFYIGN